MGKNTTAIPKSSMERILKSAGAKRVSDDASKELVDLVTIRAQEICKKAEKLSKHAGRKTILEEDIKLASRK